MNTVYQIYPLGAFGAPFENDGIGAHRILQVLDWVDHLRKLGVDTVLFNPFVQSKSHGYDTVDMETADVRLGTNADMETVCNALHDTGFQILFDGVFNHVGRDNPKFQDVLKNREASPFKDWFFVDFNGNNGRNDGLWYQDWEGHDELVKLNLQNPAVKEYLFSVIQDWVDRYHVDGLRLDVAYMLDHGFLRELRSRFPGLFLLGETLHGDYNTWVNPEMLDSCTNYECYKGLHSSFNSHNFFEILYSFNRQFGKEPWCLYTGKTLLSFVENHDVNRIASQLEDAANLPLIYTMLFAMPGLPCIYYGGEWGMKGVKNANDTALRPAVEAPVWNELTDHIAKLAEIRASLTPLQSGDYAQVALTNEACLFSRTLDGKTVWCAINMKKEPVTLNFPMEGTVRDLISGMETGVSGSIGLPACSGQILEAV